MAAGYKVGVHNNSTGSITITRATGADTINGSAKNLTLGAQQRASFRVNAAANGYIMENANPLLTDSTDASKQATFDLSGVTTGTLRTLTVPDASGTISLATLATQADEETATSTTTYSSPGRQHFHPGHPKAWGRITPATTVAASYPAAGVSVVRNSAGDFTVTHGVTMSSASTYIPLLSILDTTSTFWESPRVSTITATTFRVVFTVNDGSHTATDPQQFAYAILGDI